MMELTDRYVYAATERLPEATRKDVIRELRANIEDMLPEDPTQSDIRVALEKLGDPRKLTDEYNQKKRYLIGPSLYDSYFSVLKLVICIITIVFVCITILLWAVNPPTNKKFAQMWVEFLLDLIITPVQRIFQGFLWVTMVLFLLLLAF